jgi:outer membrane murein-binding lipoprotein Lpp
MPTISWRAIRAALVSLAFTALFVACAYTVLAGCTDQSKVDRVAGAGEDAVATVRANLGDVAAYLEAAAANLEAAPAVNAELVAAREALEAEEYSDALSRLQAGLDLVVQAGHEVPPEVPERLAQAELLLRLVGR